MKVPSSIGKLFFEYLLPNEAVMLASTGKDFNALLQDDYFQRAFIKAFPSGEQLRALLHSAPAFRLLYIEQLQAQGGTRTTFRSPHTFEDFIFSLEVRTNQGTLTAWSGVAHPNQYGGLQLPMTPSEMCELQLNFNKEFFYTACDEARFVGHTAKLLVTDRCTGRMARLISAPGFADGYYDGINFEGSICDGDFEEMISLQLIAELDCGHPDADGVCSIVDISLYGYNLHTSMLRGDATDLDGPSISLSDFYWMFDRLLHTYSASG
jgi:hypothetical protein